MLYPERTTGKKPSAFKRIIGFTAEDTEFAEDSNDFHCLCDLGSARARRVVKILISVLICEPIVLGFLASRF